MADNTDAISNMNKVKIKDEERKQEPYKATQLWHRLITHLKMNAICKRRRYRIRQYDDCFTGENAVDVIYDCLLREKETCTLITNKVTRSIAVKVCQALMDNSIIVVVGSKSCQADSSNHYLFEDCVTKLYKFTDQQTDEPQCQRSEENRLKVHDTKLTNHAKPIMHTARLNEHSCPSTPLNSSLENSKNWFTCISPFQEPFNHSSNERRHVTSDSLGISSSPVLTASWSSGIIGSEQEQSLSFSKKRKLRSSARLQSAIFHGGVLKQLASEQKENVAGLRCANGSVEPLHHHKNGKPNLLKFQKRLSTSNTNLANSGDQDRLSHSVDVDKIWREVALARLLAILDLPFLEDILPSPKKTLQKSDCQAVIINSAIVSNLDLSPKTDNLWIQFAQEITESRCFFLDNPIGLTENQLKLQAFEKILRYYHSLPSPIIPENLSKVFVAILGLIKAENYAVAIHALQLAALLLPWQQRREFKNLIKFMKLATDDTTVKLHPKLTNHQYVLHQFSPVIIRYELLGKDQAAILNSFILHHHSMILSPPPEVKKEVERLYIESTFTDELPQSAICYCQRVSSDVYKEQSKSISRKALQDLMNSILDSIDMPLKDKEHWVKKFKKYHYGIYTSVYMTST